MTRRGVASAEARATAEQVNSPNLRRRFSRGVMWNTTAVAFNQGSTFAANLLVANILGRSGFGAYAIVLSTVQAAAQLASLGMGSTATRYLAEFRVAHKTRAEAILGFTMTVAVASAVIAALALILGGEWIAAHLLKNPQLVGLLRLSGIIALFAVMNLYLMGALAGLEAFSSLGRANVIAGLVYVTAAGVGALKWGLQGACWGMAISYAVQCVLLCTVFARAARASSLALRRRPLHDDRPIVTRWVIPGVLGGFTSTAALWALQAFLARTHDGLAAVALYGAAYNLMTIVLFLPNVANSVGLTLLSNLLGARDAEQYRKFFWHNMRATLGVVLVGAGTVAVTGHLLLRLYGESFELAFIPLLVLLVAAIPESLTIALSQVILAQERIWTSIAWINIPRDVAILGVAAFLIPTSGPLGASVAYLSGRLIGLIATSLLVGRLGLQLPASRASLVQTGTVLQ